MPVHGHSQADEKQVEFRFDEALGFNIPFKPVVMGSNPNPNPNQV